MSVESEVEAEDGTYNQWGALPGVKDVAFFSTLCKAVQRKIWSPDSHTSLAVGP